HQRTIVQLSGAESIRVQAAIEVDMTGRESDFQSAQVVAAAQAQFRQAVVGTIEAGGGNEGIDDLDALGANASKPVLGTEIESPVALQMGAAGNIEAAAAEVAEIIDVADRFIVDVGGPMITDATV